MTARVLGRRLEPDHDERSRSYGAVTAQTLLTVEHEHVGPVLDQGDLGACTGYAACQALNTRPLLAPGRRLLTGRDADAVYSAATLLDPWPGTWPVEDTGSSGLAAAKATRRHGLITGYRWAFGLRHTLAALVRGPVIIGIPWLEGMFDPTPEGLLEPTGDVVGGHEIALIGLDVAAETVTALNSWGPGWGSNGTARMRWEVLGGLLAAGGDATMLEVGR